MKVTLYSFSYKDKNKPDADYIVDTRQLPNPYKHYKNQTGKDKNVQKFVLNKKAMGYLADADILIYNALHQGHESISLAFGCFGGKHRSVAMAEVLAAILKKAGRVEVQTVHLNL